MKLFPVTFKTMRRHILGNKNYFFDFWKVLKWFTTLSANVLLVRNIKLFIYISYRASKLLADVNVWKPNIISFVKQHIVSTICVLRTSLRYEHRTILYTLMYCINVRLLFLCMLYTRKCPPSWRVVHVASSGNGS